MSRLTFTPGGALEGRLADELLRVDGPATLPAGTRVGSFKILRELGRGGLGVVYLAERADDAFEQQVALKLVRPGHDQGGGTLFERERRILARLEHPGIARLIDGGHCDGLIWFAMEYVQGRRIDHYCHEHELDGTARLRLLLKVCDAVAYAHAHLVVHRDIKPPNILVNASGEPRLLDFGIAGVLDEVELPDPGGRAATPGFASPEQCRGERPGIASDVYQLGRLLDVLMQRQSWPDRHGLAAVSRRALHERPERRYPSVDALATDLRALLACRPVGAGERRWRYRAGLFLRRHRLASAASAVVLLAFVGTVGYFLWHLDAARLQAEREAATAQRVSEFMIGVFEGADPNNHRGQVPTAFELLARGRERVELELADEPEVKAALQAALGRIHLAMGERDTAMQLLEQAVAHGETDEQLSAVELAERKQFFSRTLSEHQVVERRHQLADALALLTGKQESRELHSTVLRELDIADCFEGSVEAAIERLSAAIAAGRGTPDEDTESFVVDLFYLGLYLNGIDRTDEAARLMGEAHERTRHLLGDDHPSTADFGSNLAVALARLGQDDAAEAMIEEAIEQTLRVFGSHSSWMAMMLGRQGDVALHRGDHTTAIDRYREAIALGDSLPPGDDINSVSALQGLGDALMAMQRWPEAKAAYQQMLARSEEGGRALGPDMGQRPLRLARALAALGECELAFDYQAQARERAVHVSRLYDIHAELAEPLPGCKSWLR